MKKALFGAAVLGLTVAQGAMAQSPQYMMEDCKLSAQQFYQEYEAGTEASYEGQRTDGTHAVNGTIYLENRSTYFSCSYNAAGDTLVEFFAEQKSWPDFVRGGGSPYQASGGGGATPVSPPAQSLSVTTERVRFPAGASSTEFPAQLPPGMMVRYQLGARNGQFLDLSFYPEGAPLTYRILNPDGSALLDELSIDTPYRGQLWQTGEHVVEVINRTGGTVQFDIYFGIN